MTVAERLVLCKKSEVVSGQAASASWDNVYAPSKAALIPLIIEMFETKDVPADTDPTDRSIHDGWSGGKPVYRASMAGRCIKELFLWRIGMGKQLPPRPDEKEVDAADLDAGQKAAKEGTRHEQWIIEDLAAQGYELAWTGEDQRELERKYKRFIVRSHPDGMIRGKELGEDWHVLECKALKEDNFKLWKEKGFESFQNYAHQVSIEMDLSQCPAFFIVKNRNTGDFEKFIFTEPPIDPKSIYRKYTTIENIIEATEEGIEPAAPDCPEQAEWYFCPFFNLGACSILASHDAEEIDELEDPAFEEILREYKTAKKIEKQAKSTIDALKVTIKDRMFKAKLKVGAYFVAHSQRTKTGFDTNHAKADLVELGKDLKDYEYSNSYMELRVTGGPKDEEGVE